jgi:hypothetical protein
LNEAATRDFNVASLATVPAPPSVSHLPHKAGLKFLWNTEFLMSLHFVSTAGASIATIVYLIAGASIFFDFDFLALGFPLGNLSVTGTPRFFLF